MIFGPLFKKLSMDFRIWRTQYDSMAPDNHDDTENDADARTIDILHENCFDELRELPYTTQLGIDISAID